MPVETKKDIPRLDQIRKAIVNLEFCQELLCGKDDKRRGHTPPATRAPESGPMMKDMVRTDLWMPHTCQCLSWPRPGVAGRYARGEGQRQTRLPHSSREMVTADSLNFDVLQIIFSYLSPPDLASLSQVCQSFLAGTLPRLYRSLGFYHNQAKRYPRVCHPSPSRKSNTLGN
jgi:hypothetical protein